MIDEVGLRKFGEWIYRVVKDYSDIFAEIKESDRTSRQEKRDQVRLKIQDART